MPLLRYPEARRIVVTIPNWIGDATMATPALRALRRNYPEARITYVARPYVRPLLAGSGWCDDFVEYDRSMAGVRAAGRRLRDERADLAVLLTNSWRTGHLVWLGRARRRVGYRRPLGPWMLTDALTPIRIGRRKLRFPTLDSYLAILYHLGVKVASRRLELPIEPEARRVAEAFFEEQGGERFAGLCPGAAFGAAKCWPPESFAAAADRLADELGLTPIVFVGPGEEETAGRIQAAARTEVRSAAGRGFGLDVFKALVAGLDLLVTNDSGPRHFGAAFGVPTVTIFGPTQQELTYIHAESEEVLQEDVDCGPCQRRTCPLDHRCMTRVTPEAVVAAAGRVLGRR